METKMREDISALQTEHAVMRIKQDQTDNVIKKLSDTLESLNSKVTKGFYIALGVSLVVSGALDNIAKIAIKFVGV